MGAVSASAQHVRGSANALLEETAGAIEVGKAPERPHRGAASQLFVSYHQLVTPRQLLTDDTNIYFMRTSPISWVKANGIKSLHHWQVAT